MDFDNTKNNGETKEDRKPKLFLKKAPDNFETMFEGCSTLNELPECLKDGKVIPDTFFDENGKLCYTLEELPEKLKNLEEKEVKCCYTLDELPESFSDENIRYMVNRES